MRLERTAEIELQRFAEASFSIQLSTDSIQTKGNELKLGLNHHKDSERTMPSDSMVPRINSFPTGWINLSKRTVQVCRNNKVSTNDLRVKFQAFL